MKTAVERAVSMDKEYQNALAKQNAALKKKEEVEFNNVQNKIVDRIVLTTNYCGAVYGSIAYWQGLLDGIKLTSELNEVTRHFN